MSDLMTIISDMNNHIAVINDELSDVRINVAILQTQMASMIFWTRTIVVAFLTILITQIWQLLILKKNNKKIIKK